jgi:hypothetical protein
MIYRKKCISHYAWCVCTCKDTRAHTHTHTIEIKFHKIVVVLTMSDMLSSILF